MNPGVRSTKGSHSSDRLRMFRRKPDLFLILQLLASEFFFAVNVGREEKNNK